jgi:hypothetical protein
MDGRTIPAGGLADAARTVRANIAKLVEPAIGVGPLTLSDRQPAESHPSRHRQCRTQQPLGAPCLKPAKRSPSVRETRATDLCLRLSITPPQSTTPLSKTARCPPKLGLVCIAHRVVIQNTGSCYQCNRSPEI